MNTDLLPRSMTPVGKQEPVDKLSYSHKAMADQIIANPGITNRELAEKFGYKSASWVSQIRASDAFQGYLAERTDEIVDPVLRMSLQERLKAVGHLAAEMILERLNDECSKPKDDFLIESAKLAAGASAYGLHKDRGTGPAVHIHVAAVAKTEQEWVERHSTLRRDAEAEDIPHRVPVPLPTDHEREP